MEGQDITLRETIEDEFRCPVCIKVFDRRSRLDSHMKSHSGERPFPCQFCGKNFSSKGNLNTHIRVHTKDRPYLCPHCNKRFSQNGQLVIHIRQHTGEKPYICSQCTKKFSCSKVLKIHMRTHTGEKPFICEYCRKGFAAYANLVVHKRIHTGERPYSCKLCGRRFEHSGNLSRHVRIHETENGSVRCIPCGEVFNGGDLLLEHTLDTHPHERDREDDEPTDKFPLVTTTDSALSTLALEDLQYSDTDDGSVNKVSQVTSSVIDDSGANCSIRSPLRICIQVPPKNIKTKRRVKKQSAKTKSKISKSAESGDDSNSQVNDNISNNSDCATINVRNILWSRTASIESSTIPQLHAKDVICARVPSEIFPNIEMQCNMLNSEIPIQESFHERHKRTPAPPPLIPIEGGSSIKCSNPEEDKRLLLKSQLKEIHQNVKDSIQRLLPCNRGDTFKKKVEISLIALIGEIKMKNFGFPKRTAEQVLIDILDMVERNPCADVRVDELERIKINFGKFLDYFLPKEVREQLGWSNPIENAIDDIIFSLAQQTTDKVASQDLNKWPHTAGAYSSCQYKKETLTKNESKCR